MINTDREKVLLAKQSLPEKNRFLEENQDRILKLAGTIQKRNLTISDDEYSIALGAVSSAIDSYQADRGNFWSYASVVIKNRLIDYHRSEKRHEREINVSDSVFDGTIGSDDPEYAMQEQVLLTYDRRQDDSLKLEIESLNKELSAYGISFFDLAASSPKAKKTRSKCAEIIKAFFLPPPLTRYLEANHKFPGSQINKRVKNAKKCIERYKNYLICIVVIIRGDYPHVAEYISYITDEIKNGKEGEGDS